MVVVAASHPLGRILAAAQAWDVPADHPRLPSASGAPMGVRCAERMRPLLLYSGLDFVDHSAGHCVYAVAGPQSLALRMSRGPTRGWHASQWRSQRHSDPRRHHWERREIGRPSCGPPCGVLAFLQRIRTVSEHPNRNHSVGTLKLYITLPDPWWEDPTRNALCSSYPLPAPVRTPSQTRAPITDSPAIVTNILVRVSVSRFGSSSLIPSRCSQHSLAPLALSLSRPTHLTGRRELWW